MSEITYQEMIEINASRKPSVETTPVFDAKPEFFSQSTAPPLSSADGSLWFNTSSSDSKIYVKYDNNWIGLR